MADIADYILKRQAALAENRGSWEEMWQEAAEYVLPRRADFLNPQAPGSRRGQRIYDSTAPLALERFAAALESVLTPRNQKWHQLRCSEKCADSALANRYLDEVNRRLFAIRYSPKANFANQLHEVYLSLGAFGTGGVFIDHLPGRGLSYRALHLADLFLAEDYGGRVDTVFRRFELTARQALAEFGEADLPADMVRAAENPRDMERAFTFIHAVMPREDLDRRRADFKGMPFASFYVALDSRTLIREGGYHSFPYAISRYVTAPREIYGRSPAIMALPDIKQVNEMERTLMKAGQKAVDPPLLLTDDDVLSPFSLRPGALNYGGLGDDGRQKVLPLNAGANMPLGFEMLEQKRKVINDAFLVSLFMVLVDSPAITATEALIRSQEKGALLARPWGVSKVSFWGRL